MSALTCSPASTMSVESDNEDLSSDLGQDLTPIVPRLKRISSTLHGPRAKKIAVSTAHIQPSSVDLKSFKFPMSPELKEYVKKGEPVPDNLRCELIRECVTCLKAENGESIPNDAFKVASKLICVEVPELADVQPPNWPKGVKFEYWVSIRSFPSYLKWTLWYIISSSTGRGSLLKGSYFQFWLIGAHWAAYSVHDIPCLGKEQSVTFLVK